MTAVMPLLPLLTFLVWTGFGLIFSQFHFDIRLHIMYQFSQNLNFTFLGTMIVSKQRNTYFTCATLLCLLFGTVVVPATSLLQYQMKYLSTKIYCELYLVCFRLC
jgi:hypothetical protein